IDDLTSDVVSESLIPRISNWVKICIQGIAQIWLTTRFFPEMEFQRECSRYVDINPNPVVWCPDDGHISAVFPFTPLDVDFISQPSQRIRNLIHIQCLVHLYQLL